MLKSRLSEIEANYKEERKLDMEKTPQEKKRNIMQNSDLNLGQEEEFIIEHLTLQDSQKESLVQTFKKINSICKNLIEQKMAFEDLEDEYKEEERKLGIQNTNESKKIHGYIKTPTNDPNRATLNKNFEERIDNIKKFVSSYLSQLNEKNNGIINLIMNYPEPKINSISKGFEEFIRNIKDYANVFINKFNRFINDKKFAKNKKLQPPKMKKLQILLKAVHRLKKKKKKKPAGNKKKKKKKKKPAGPAGNIKLEINGQSIFQKK